MMQTLWSSTQRLVNYFHARFGIPIGEKAGLMDVSRIPMRMALIEEEHAELELAVAERDLVEMMDALADLVYVCYGFAAEAGVNLDDVIAEVHRTNMDKVWSVEELPEPGYGLPFEVNGEECKVIPVPWLDGFIVERLDGKIIKPPHWEPPRIYDALRRQGWQGRYR